MASDTRDRILDALERLLLDVGLAQVTIEGVADEAGVSKGGLLYHFPSKEALLGAMVRRLGERSDAQMDEAVSGGSTAAQWYLQIPDSSSMDSEAALYRSMIAALRTVDGQHTEVQNAMIDVMRAWDSQLRAEIDDPVQAEIVRLVGDGVYLAALLGLPKPEPELYRKVVERLLGDDTDR
ncbi:TetR/AcrR family transcriptional regulator [Rhodococcus rhodnii]|uniref:TetR family transcriptional regulator n=2 Tax=Rhodococcus rhodnii TaxID=38312 RepID=R7WTK5_9NOCA|nr:TetR/AcrR family transcriptional regulator [Rhodococcus rhodnii]EOM78605.1 TetR family transcriptional regulator [Rhodococcus rhodnii LMG 5362]TXG91383.1 TetR/AcrR family transcriptional regulator [Rhodococcus rhodnii]